VHWADDATLDVLRYLGRRVDDLPLLVVVTYRDDEVGPSLQRVLGALAGPGVRRLAPARLSRSAVARLAGGTTLTSAPLYRLTAGNPFFVSEMVAAAGSGEGVPSTVVDAVLARMQRLAPDEQAALEQLSVLPSGVELRLAGELLGDLGVLAAAERTGLVELRTHAVGFRHELSRCAVESALPAAVRMQCNARMLAVLLAEPDPDLTRVVHHAVAAGDEAAVIAHAPAAARAASRLGAHAQEVALQEQALRHRQLLDPAEEAALWQEHAAALTTLGRIPEALEAGRHAVRLGEDRGEPGPLAAALTALALVYWAMARPRECLANAERAVQVLAADGDSHQHAYALAYLSGLRGSVDRDEEAWQAGTAASEMARRLGAPELLALGAIACGTSRLKRGDPGGVDDLIAGVAGAATLGAHVCVMTGYVLLVQDLFNLGRFADAERWIAEATQYARERDLALYLDHLAAYGFRLQVAQGGWETAEAGLRNLLGTGETSAIRYSLPELSRLLVRSGAADADVILGKALAYSRRADGRYELTPALMARIESAWLTGRPQDAREAAEPLRARTAGPGAERPRADLLRWLRRLGEPVTPFPGCPPEYAAGLRGDWCTPRTGSPNGACPTSRHWSSPTPAKSPPPSRPCASWTSWARGQPPRCCADDYENAASPKSRAGPHPRRARTRQA